MAKSSSPVPASLLYSSTERSADALYLGQVDVPDAFLAIEFEGHKLAVLSRLEIARVRREGAFDEVISLEALGAELAARGKPATPAEMVMALAEAWEIPAFRIGSEFPAGLALELQARGVALEVREGMLCVERELKSDAEAAAIRQGNEAAAAGFRVAEKALRARARGSRDQATKWWLSSLLQTSGCQVHGSKKNPDVAREGCMTGFTPSAQGWRGVKRPLSRSGGWW